MKTEPEPMRQAPDRYIPTPEEQAAADRALGRPAQRHDLGFVKGFTFL